MKYGCIGEHLKHSFSKEIHGYLTDYEYEIHEVEREKLDDFMVERDFRAINVTIPYKELVIPHLYYIDAAAEAIGAVNTVVNRDGLLYGYNTDFYGITRLLAHAGVTVGGKKVVILGTGGTSKTAMAVAKSLGAREVIRVSRTGREDAVTYEEFYENHSDAEILLNTTPVGMFPNIFNSPVDISGLDRLSGVIDTIYNPLRTPLVMAARARGIAAEGGLFMLVAQAVRASEKFIDTEYGLGECDRVYKKMLSDKENIVLVGMPASGKSTVGAILADLTGRRIVDTDEMIVERAGKEITRIFAEDGEAEFRRLESECVKEASAMTSVIIATGGGAVLREDNVSALKENGRLYFIDRPLEKLIPTASRPLSSDRAAIEKRYNERYGLYCRVADVRIDADVAARTVAERIISDFGL